MTQITAFELTTVWVEVNLALTEMDPPQTPLAFLGRPQAYQQTFAQMQHALRVHAQRPLTPPWPHTKGQNFWTYYLGGRTNANISGKTAWHHAVPVRTGLPLRLGNEQANSINDASFSLFFYPYAVAFMASIRQQTMAPLTLEAWVEAAFSLRFDRLYQLEWAGDDNALFDEDEWNPPFATLTLNQVADTALALGRQTAFGPRAGEGRRTAAKPFTVITVLAGDGVDLAQPMAANSDIHRALHAVTDWSKVGAGINLALTDEVKVPLGKDSGVADMIYGQRRGRTVWYPNRFTNAEEDRNLLKLGCYHRNLSLLSMQTESMCGLATALMERQNAGGHITPYQRELARHAGGAVGRLYGGKEGIQTYRSFSPRRQIDDNHWEQAVNMMREEISDSYMMPLH